MKEAILITLLLSTLLAFYEYNKIDIVGTELSSDIDDESNNVNIDYVRDLDIERYMGLWYVIASKPNIIEKYCKCARTEDVLVDDSTIELAETCWLLGKKITSRSKAIIEEPRTGHWTNVVKAIKADYWVIDVSPDYSWSVVGQPKGKGYWIFSRETSLDQTIVDALMEKARGFGFDLSDIEVADQTCV